MVRNSTSQTSIIVQERDSLARKLRDVENTAATLSSELERLNQVLRKKVDENQSLSMRLGELELQGRTVADLQTRILVLTREKETLVIDSQKSNDGLRESLNSLKNENNTLRQNLQELPRLQERLNSAVRENEELRRKISELNEMLRKVNEQEAKVLRLSQENEKLAGMLEQKNR